MKKVLVNKRLKVDHPVFCNYIHRFCNQTRLDGYSYCIRHILEDKSAPFRQCSFVHPQNRKRCTNAAEKNEKRESLCPWHSKRAAVLGSKTVSRKKTVEKPAMVLANFENFCQDNNHNPLYRRAAVEKDRKDSLGHESAGASDTKSLGLGDQHTPLSETYICGIEDDSEDVDSEEDCMKHAGVYTVEEVSRIAREKVFRLQSLYIDQLKRLKHALHESRRSYLHAVNNEPDIYSDVSQRNPEDKNSEEITKALTKYHRYSGNEAILHRRSLKVRGLLPDDEVEESICCYSTRNLKCKKKAVVFTEFCLEHILCDTNQMIYKHCCGENECKKPVLDISESPTCSMHRQFKVESEQASIEEEKKEISSEDTDFSLDLEHFQSMDDIASLGLDLVTPGCLFGLDQFGEPGESTDTVLSEDQADLMEIQPITLNPPENIMNDSRKSESDDDKYYERQ